MKLEKSIHKIKTFLKTYLKRQYFDNRPTIKQKLKYVLQTEGKWY